MKYYLCGEESRDGKEADNNYPLSPPHTHTCGAGEEWGANEKLGEGAARNRGEGAKDNDAGAEHSPSFGDTLD